MPQRKQIKPEEPKAKAKATKADGKDKKVAKHADRRTASFRYESDRNVKDHVVDVVW